MLVFTAIRFERTMIGRRSGRPTVSQSHGSSRSSGVELTLAYGPDLALAAASVDFANTRCSVELALWRGCTSIWHGRTPRWFAVLRALTKRQSSVFRPHFMRRHDPPGLLASVLHSFQVVEPEVAVHTIRLVWRLLGAPAGASASLIDRRFRAEANRVVDADRRPRRMRFGREEPGVRLARQSLRTPQGRVE